MIGFFYIMINIGTILIKSEKNSKKVLIKVDFPQLIWYNKSK